MAASLVPSDGADCLDRLGKNFQLAAEVVEALSKAGIANLEEFRFFFDAEAKVEPWLGKIQLGAEAQIQAARPRFPLRGHRVEISQGSLLGELQAQIPHGSVPQ